MMRNIKEFYKNDFDNYHSKENTFIPIEKNKKLENTVSNHTDDLSQDLLELQRIQRDEIKRAKKAAKIKRIKEYVDAFEKGTKEELALINFNYFCKDVRDISCDQSLHGLFANSLEQLKLVYDFYTPYSFTSDSFTIKNPKTFIKDIKLLANLSSINAVTQNKKTLIIEGLNAKEICELLANLKFSIKKLEFKRCIIDSTVIESLSKLHTIINLENVTISNEDLKKLCYSQVKKYPDCLSVASLLKTPHGISFGSSMEGSQFPFFSFKFVGAKDAKDVKDLYEFCDIIKDIRKDQKGEKEIILINSYHGNIDIKDDTITRLEISNNTLTSDSIKNFSMLLSQGLTKIQYLMLDNLKFINNKDKEDFLKVLNSKTNLKQLSLLNFPFTEEHAGFIFSLIKNNPQLKWFNLCGMSVKVMNKLADYLIRYNLSLDMLYVRDSTTREWESAITRNQKIPDLKKDYLNIIHYLRSTPDAKNNDYSKMFNDFAGAGLYGLRNLEKYVYPDAESVKNLRVRLSEKLKTTIDHSDSLKQTQDIYRFASYNGLNELEINIKLKMLDQLTEEKINSAVIKQFYDTVSEIEDKINKNDQHANVTILNDKIIRFAQKITASNFVPQYNYSSKYSIEEKYNPDVFHIFTLMNKISEQDLPHYNQIISLQKLFGCRLIAILFYNDRNYNDNELFNQLMNNLIIMSPLECVTEYMRYYHELLLLGLQRHVDNAMEGQSSICAFPAMLNFLWRIVDFIRDNGDNLKFCFKHPHPISSEVRVLYEQAFIDKIQKYLNAYKYLSERQFVQILEKITNLKFNEENFPKVQNLFIDMVKMRIFTEISYVKKQTSQFIAESKEIKFSKRTNNFILSVRNSTTLPSIQKHIEIYLEKYFIDRALRKNLNSINQVISNILSNEMKYVFSAPHTNDPDEKSDEKKFAANKLNQPKPSAPAIESITPIIEPSAPSLGEEAPPLKDVKSIPPITNTAAMLSKLYGSAPAIDAASAAREKANNIPNLLLECSDSTKEFKASVEKSTSIAELKLTADEQKGFEQELIDPIRENIIDIPVRLNGNIYNLESLTNLPEKSPGVRVDPLTTKDFYLIEIQPARDILEKIKDKIKTIQENRKKAMAPVVVIEPPVLNKAASKRVAVKL